MYGAPPEADFLPFTRPVIDEQTIAEVSEVLRSGWIPSGPKCLALEAALSTRFGGRAVRLASPPRRHWNWPCGCVAWVRATR